MNSNEAFTDTSYIHEQEFHLPNDSTKRALGEIALPGTLIDSADVPFKGTAVAQPGAVANQGARHEPIPVERVSNPERVINHPANIAKNDRDFTAMTGIVVRRDHSEK